MGVRFTQSVNGYINGIKFYRHNTNSGPHNCHLWTIGGALLASAQITTPAGPSGWFQATFATPIAVNGGTTYVASTHTTDFYGFTNTFFPFANSPLSASSATAGVRKAGANPTFPDATADATNYWVDVEYEKAADVSVPDLSWQQRGALHAPLRTNYHLYGSETFAPIPPPLVENLSWQQRGALHAPLRTNYHLYGSETFAPINLPPIVDLSWQQRGALHAPLRTSYHQTGEAFEPVRLPDPAPIISDLSWQQRGALHAPLRIAYHQTGEVFEPVREPDPDPPPVAEPHADYDTQPMGGGSNTGYIASATSGNLDKFLDEHELLQKQVTNAWDGVSGTLEDAWERPEELGETPTDEELTAPPENPVVTWDELPEGAELDELLVDTDGAVEEAYPADPEAPEPEQHLSVPEDAEKPGRLATLASLLPPPSSGAAVSGYSAMAGYAAAKAGKLLLEKAEPTSDWAKKHGNVVAAAAATGAALVLSTKINFLKERRGAIALGGAIAVLELAGESFAAEQQAAQPLADAITPPDPGPDPTQDELDAVWQGVETEDALGDDQPVQPRPASNKARYVEKQKKKRGLAALGDLLPPPTSGASGSGGASVAGYATAKAGKMLMEKVEPTSDWGKKHGKVVAAAAATGAALLLSTKVGFLKKNRGEIALGGILAVLELASEAYGAKKTEEPDIPDNTTPLLLVGDEEE